MILKLGIPFRDWQPITIRDWLQMLSSRFTSAGRDSAGGHPVRLSVTAPGFSIRWRREWLSHSNSRFESRSSSSETCLPVTQVHRRAKAAAAMALGLLAYFFTV